MSRPAISRLLIRPRPVNLVPSRGRQGNFPLSLGHHPLAWFFRKSRDTWKQKHQALQTTLKHLKNQLNAVTKSRQQWRIKAEQAAQ